MATQYKYMKAQSWCLENNMKIYIEPISKGRKPNIRIVINNKGKIIKGEKIYTQDNKVSKVIYNLYLHLYDKFH